MDERERVSGTVGGLRDAFARQNQFIPFRHVKSHGSARFIYLKTHTKAATLATRQEGPAGRPGQLLFRPEIPLTAIKIHRDDQWRR